MAVTISGSDGITGDLTSIQLGNGTQSAPVVTGQDTDTGIFFGTNEIKVSTGGTEAVVVDSSQQVGIGTSSPASLLHVDTGSGNFQVSSFGVSSINIQNSVASGVIRYIAAGGHRFASSGSAEFARISSNGNFGIGTISPQGLLDVKKDNATGEGATLAIRNTGTGVGTSVSLHLAPNNGGGDDLQRAASIKSRQTTSGNYADLGFFTANSDVPLERMTINTTGKVGIGTTSPDGRLEVRDSSATGIISRSTSTQSTDTNKALKVRNNSATNTFAVSYRGQGFFAESVGIGTSSPDAKLEVDASGSDYFPAIELTNSTGTGSSIRSKRGLSLESDYLNNSPASSSYIVFKTDNTERMLLDTAGKLILGGITPATAVAYSLCTSGRLQTTASYTNTTGSAANMHINSSGLVIRSTSSARYKTNIETLEDSYADKLLECRPVWYRSTATDDTAHPEWGYYGFIAEEVADVDPRLVHYDEQEDGTLQPEGVQYTQMTAHLVNIVKRQKKAIATLETKVAALEAAE